MEDKEFKKLCIDVCQISLEQTLEMAKIIPVDEYTMRCITKPYHLIRWLKHSINPATNKPYISEDNVGYLIKLLEHSKVGAKNLADRYVRPYALHKLLQGKIQPKMVSYGRQSPVIHGVSGNVTMSFGNDDRASNLRSIVPKFSVLLDGNNSSDYRTEARRRIENDSEYSVENDYGILEDDSDEEHEKQLSHLYRHYLKPEDKKKNLPEVPSHSIPKPCEVSYSLDPIKKEDKDEENLLPELKEGWEKKLVKHDGNGECTICMEYLADVVLVECSHQIMCMKCTKQRIDNGMNNCPFCSKKITKKVIWVIRG